MARVLVIDDDAQFRGMLRRALERGGYEVDDAEDGPQAVRAFTERPAHLAIVDLYMPEQSGWETIRALRERASKLPFVVVTGGGAMEAVAKGTTSTMETLRAEGLVRLLRKPFELHALMDAVQQLLHARQDAGAGD